MPDAFDELLHLTETFLERLRSGRAEPGEFQQLLLDRERLIEQVKVLSSVSNTMQARFDALLELDEQLHRWCHEAQQSLAQRLTHIRRRTSPRNDSGRLVLESA